MQIKNSEEIMQNRVFTDFEELLTSIEDFKTNIENSNKLFDLLNNVVSKIDVSRKALGDKYDSFLSELNNANDNLIKQSESVTSTFIHITKQQEETIENANKSLDVKYDGFLAEIKKANENLSKQSEDVLQKWLQVITEQKNEFDDRYKKFLEEISRANNNINAQSEYVISTFIKVNKHQEETFEKKTDVIMERLDKVDMELISREIKKANARTNLLLGGMGVVIVAGLIGLFIK